MGQEGEPLGQAVGAALHGHTEQPQAALCPWAGRSGSRLPVCSALDGANAQLGRWRQSRLRGGWSCLQNWWLFPTPESQDGAGALHVEWRVIPVHSLQTPELALSLVPVVGVRLREAVVPCCRGHLTSGLQPGAGTWAGSDPLAGWPPEHPSP